MQIPDDVRRAFDDEIWEGFIPGPRTLWKRLLHMVTLLERDVGARTPLEWILESPLQAIMLGGFVRLYTFPWNNHNYLFLMNL